MAQQRPGPLCLQALALICKLIAFARSWGKEIAAAGEGKAPTNFRGEIAGRFIMTRSAFTKAKRSGGIAHTKMRALAELPAAFDAST